MKETSSTISFSKLNQIVNVIKGQVRRWPGWLERCLQTGTMMWPGWSGGQPISLLGQNVREVEARKDLSSKKSSLVVPCRQQTLKGLRALSSTDIEGVGYQQIWSGRNTYAKLGLKRRKKEAILFFFKKIFRPRRSHTEAAISLPKSEKY